MYYDTRGRWEQAFRMSSRAVPGALHTGGALVAGAVLSSGYRAASDEFGRAIPNVERRLVSAHRALSANNC